MANSSNKKVMFSRRFVTVSVLARWLFRSRRSFCSRSSMHEEWRGRWKWKFCVAEKSVKWNGRYESERETRGKARQNTDLTQIYSCWIWLLCIIWDHAKNIQGPCNAFVCASRERARCISSFAWRSAGDQSINIPSLFDIHHAKLIRLIQTCNNSIAAKASLTHLIICIGFERFINSTSEAVDALQARFRPPSWVSRWRNIIWKITLTKEEKRESLSLSRTRCTATLEKSKFCAQYLFLENCVSTWYTSTIATK